MSEIHSLWIFLYQGIFDVKSKISVKSGELLKIKIYKN
jgi:hypothetical protein